MNRGELADCQNCIGHSGRRRFEGLGVFRAAGDFPGDFPRRQFKSCGFLSGGLHRRETTVAITRRGFDIPCPTRLFPPWVVVARRMMTSPLRQRAGRHC